MELPAVNLKVILLGHWLLTVCFCVACWPLSSWTSCTSASSTRRETSRTRSALAQAWPSSACCSSRSPAASSTTCTGSVGVSSWSTLVSLDLLRTVVPTRRLIHQRHPQIPLQSQRAGVKMPEGTEASHAAPGMLLTSISGT
uniref:Angiotensin II receptor associated protein n=1 Tax=Saimiri boliviensis boliviensis TaxID=39432 RepID=A0A2K6TH91_SAIBB